MQERFGADVPFLLRLLGCLAIERAGRGGINLRFKGGVELVPGFAFGVKYMVYHDTASLVLKPLIFSLYVKVPMILKQRAGTEDWDASFGFDVHLRDIHLNWRTRSKVVRMPWDWSIVRTSILKRDGSRWRNVRGYQWMVPDEFKETHTYRYLRFNGETQVTKATAYGEEREWRLRWAKWLPWPRMVRRTICVSFADEIGEGVGSWKGGTVGTGFEWRDGEPILAAIRRMEREVYFSR